MPIDFDNAKAFEPLFDTPAVVAGSCREGSSARRVSQRVKACVLGGGADAGPLDGIGPSGMLAYSVLVRVSEWRDCVAPQSGYTVTADGHPALAVRSVQRRGSFWRLECRSSEG